jgi:CrcB protein
MNTLYVMLFGALGAAARFGVGHAVAREGSELPWHTLLVNAGGSFLFGILAMTPREAEFADLIRFGLGIGFCGAFTTFSTFSYEGFRMLEQGQPARAVTYALVSVVASLAAIFAGVATARLLFPSS